MNPDLPSADALLALLAGFGILLVLILVVVIVVAHLIGKAAVKKNRSYGSFFALSLLLSPLITGLVVAALPFEDDDPRHPKNKK
jgi:hypothetical protein